MHTNNNLNQSNNFNRRFLLPKEPTNKMPSVSLLNNASMSNIIENNILSFLNDNLNNVHKSRNVNKTDNVYNVGTNANKDLPKRLINRDHNECNKLVDDNNSTILSKNIVNDHAIKDNIIHDDLNKIVTCTFKKEGKKHNDNLHVFTSYTNAIKKNGTGYKPLFAKKTIENTQNIPIVLLDKNDEDKKSHK